MVVCYYVEYDIDGSCTSKETIDLLLEEITFGNYQKNNWWNYKSSNGSNASTILFSHPAYDQLYNFDYFIPHIWHTINNSSSSK